MAQVTIKQLHTEYNRLMKLYDFYLTKALETLHYNEVQYKSYVDSARNVRKQMHKIDQQVKEMEEL